jgi:pilus assembly protein CpaE
MSFNLLLMSGDTRLTARLQAALDGECTLMTADPRAEEGQSLARRFDPDGVIVDGGAHTGARTVLENIAALREQFASLPLIVIGDEMSAQMILSSFRAGANDFLDRESPDAELRSSILARLRRSATQSAHAGGSQLIDILSPSPSDEDYDFALNMASLIAQDGAERRVLLLDFSLPASPARVALGVELGFAIPDAIRDIARLDRTFLDSALARAPGSGLYILPLAEERAAAALPALRDVLVLLQILRSLFDVVVIFWGAFSRQAALGGLSGENRQLYLCCNQRFASVRNAKNLLGEIRAADAPQADPVLVLQQCAPNLMPAPDDVLRAVGGSRMLVLRAAPAALVQAQNSGVPLCQSGPSAYGDALRLHLAEAGLLPGAQPDRGRTLDLLQWLRKAKG